MNRVANWGYTRATPEVVTIPGVSENEGTLSSTSTTDSLAEFTAQTPKSESVSTTAQIYSPPSVPMDFPLTGNGQTTRLPAGVVYEDEDRCIEVRPVSQVDMYEDEERCVEIRANTPSYLWWQGSQVQGSQSTTWNSPQTTSPWNYRPYPSYF